MANSQPANDDPADRIRAILAELMDTIEKSVSDIHQIAEQEMQRVGEDTPEGQAWYGFGAEMPFSDVGRAAYNIQWEIAAVRGRMVYRQLDSSQRDFAPLNQAAVEQQDKQDV